MPPRRKRHGAWEVEHNYDHIDLLEMLLLPLLCSTTSARWATADRISAAGEQLLKNDLKKEEHRDGSRRGRMMRAEASMSDVSIAPLFLRSPIITILEDFM